MAGAVGASPCGARAARVIVNEVNPLKALEALMDGYEVLPTEQAAKIGDIFCTVTGDINVIRAEHFCSAGKTARSFPIPGTSTWKSTSRPWSASAPPASDSGRGGRIYPERRRLPLCAGRRPPGQPGRGRGPPGGGHGYELRQSGPVGGIHSPNHQKFQKQVYPVPEDIDREIARLKLAAMQVDIDTLTPEQVKYLASYDLGT